MKEVKAYKKQESDCEMVVSEPAGMYGPTYLQGLKNRLIVSIKESNDEAMLEQCLELLHRGSMPCVYTDEEFAEEIRLAEESGFVSHEEALKTFEQWGVVCNSY